MRLITRLALFILPLVIFLAGCSTPNEPEHTPTNEIPSIVEPTKTLAPTSTTTSIPTVVLPESESSALIISEYNAGSLELVSKLEGHSDRLLSLTVDMNGWLISGGIDNRILIWPDSLKEPTLLATMPQGVCDLQVSPDNLLLAYAFNHQANLWDLNSMELVSDTDFAEDGYKGSFTPDGSIFVTQGRGGKILFWDTGKQEQIKTFNEPNGGGFAYRFSPDGKFFASSSHNGTVTVWEYETGEIVHSLKNLDGDMHDMEFSPDGSLLAAGSTNSIVVVWDVETGERLHILYHNDGLNGVAFSPDGSLLASAATDRTVKVWDVETGRSLATLRHADELNDVIFSADGTRIYSGGYDNVIYVWEVVE